MKADTLIFCPEYNSSDRTRYVVERHCESVAENGWHCVNRKDAGGHIDYGLFRPSHSRMKQELTNYPQYQEKGDKFRS
jgi:hypothetical protein